MCKVSHALADVVTRHLSNQSIYKEKLMWSHDPTPFFDPKPLPPKATHGYKLTRKKHFFFKRLAQIPDPKLIRLMRNQLETKTVGYLLGGPGDLVSKAISTHIGVIISYKTSVPWLEILVTKSHDPPSTTVRQGSS